MEFLGTVEFQTVILREAKQVLGTLSTASTAFLRAALSTDEPLLYQGDCGTKAKHKQKINKKEK